MKAKDIKENKVYVNNNEKIIVLFKGEEKMLVKDYNYRNEYSVSYNDINSWTEYKKYSDKIEELYKNLTYKEVKQLILKISEVDGNSTILAYLGMANTADGIQNLDRERYNTLISIVGEK